MDVDIAINITVNMDVDMADDMNADNSCFLGQYQVAQIFSAY
jgi:hypothetical protein